MIVKKQVLKRIIKEEISRFLTEASYTVKRGDSLSKIARANNISLDSILSANSQFDRALLGSQGSSPGPNDRQGNTGRNPNWIYPGETIQIPGSTEGGPSSPRASGATGIEGLEWPDEPSPGQTASSGIPGLEMPTDWPDRKPSTTPAREPSSPPRTSRSPEVSQPARPRSERTAPETDIAVSLPTIATQGSGPIQVPGTGGRIHNLEIDSAGRIRFGGRTYSLEADVMGGVDLEVERIDASGTPVMITVDPAVGRSQTKPIRPQGIAQMEAGEGRSEFTVDPAQSGSPSIIFTAV